MPLYTDRNEAQPIGSVFLIDNAGDPLVGIEHDDELLTISVRRWNETVYTEITLLEGTVGTYQANTWKEVGDGEYQLCLAANVVVAGKETKIKGKYDTNKIQFDKVVALGNDAIAIRSSIGMTSANLDSQITALGTTLAGVFDDADVSSMVTLILSAIKDGLDATDLSTQAIANLTANTILNRVLNGTHDTSGTVGKLLQVLDGLSSTGGLLNVSVSDIIVAALAKFATEDTGETVPVAGSVARLSGYVDPDNSTNVVEVGGNELSYNANAQWPSAVLADDNFVGKPYYQGTQWTMTFRPLGVVPAGEELIFALKSELADEDSESVIEVQWAIDSDTTTVTVVNGVAAPTATDATLTYSDWVDPSDSVTKKQAVLVIKDDTTALIAAGTYHRGFKRVGDSEVLIQDKIQVAIPVTKAITP